MIYVAIIGGLTLLALLHDVLNVRQGRTVSYWGAYVVLVCLAGFRYKVGGDTYNYMSMHELLPDLSGLFDRDVGIAKLQHLWLLFSATAKSIGEEFYILQCMHAIVLNLIVFKFIRSGTRFRHSGILLYSFSLYPVFNFEIIREALAICCFLLSVRHYSNRNWLRYYLLVTIAFLFHYSAVFLFLLPIVRNVRLGMRGLLLIFVVATMLNPLVMKLVGSSEVMDLIGFAVRDYEGYDYTFFGLVSIFILNFFVPLVLVSLARDRFKIDASYGLVAEKGLIVSACIPLFFIFYRFFNYFALLYLLATVEVVHAIIRRKWFMRFRPIGIPALFCLCFAFYTARYFQDTSRLVEGTRWYNLWYPYHSIFDPIEVPVRGQMIDNQNWDSYQKSR